jgi:MYXO-CTERM domain-containing protein
MRIAHTSAVLAVAALAGLAHAQITSGNSPSVYTSNAITYSQNFNGLATSGTNTWTQNSTVLGWRAFYANSGSGTVGARTAATAGAGVYVGDNGSLGAPASLYSYGPASNTDRALGALPFGNVSTSSGQRRGDYVVWVAIRNDTDVVDGIGSILNEATIGFRGEQWRNAGHAILDSIQVDYRVYGQGVLTSTDPSNNSTIGWTAVPSLTFTSPVTGGTEGALDGNDAANSQSLSVNLTGLDWNPGDANNFGETLVVRFWWDSRNSFLNEAHSLAIDDFRLSAVVPTPGAMGLVALGLLTAGRRRR